MPWRRVLCPRGSRREKLAWLLWLSIKKLREGPVPWLRAVRRGLFDLLPPGLKARLARGRLAVARRPSIRAAGILGIEEPGLVSVVLPVYDHAALLGESIDSVLAQTYAELELIVLDDGSTDAIDAVLAGYDDDRLRVLRQPNLGLPAALTNAFAFARGELRTWTSADNLMEPRQLERLVAFLRANPDTAMVYADYLVIGPDGEPLQGSDFRPHNRSSPASAEVRLPRSTESLNFVQDNFIGACFLYRAWVGRVVGAYSGALGLEDYDYWMRINAQFRIVHLGTDELLYRYRWHDDSLNAKAKELRLDEQGRQLMAEERRRAGRRAQAWTLFHDPAHRVSIAGSEEWAGTAPEQALLFVAGGSLPPGYLDRLPPGLCVAVVFDDDPRPVYRLAAELRAPGRTAFGRTADVVEALALFTERAFWIDGDPTELAIACANEVQSSEPLPLPSVWRPPGRRRRLLLQVEDFAQGGLERVVLDLAPALRDHGFDPELLVLGTAGEAAGLARESGLEVRELETRDADSYSRAIDGIDLIHAHHSTFGAERAHAAGVPFVQTVHNTYVWLYPEDIDRYREADPFTAAYVCVSSNVAAYAHERLALSPRRALVLHNGVGPSHGDATGLRGQLGLGHDDYVFLNVGAIYPAKAQRVIAAALARARERDPRIKVVCVGRVINEVYALELGGDLERLGLEDALVLASFRDDASAFYRMADAFLLPSFWEGCSLAVAEALESGLPAVLSDVGAAREQMRSGAGTLVQPPFEWITDVDFTNFQSISETVDPSYVERLAAAMLDVAARFARVESTGSRFGLEPVADRHARLYDWLIAGGHAAAARAWTWEERA